MDMRGLVETLSSGGALYLVLAAGANILANTSLKRAAEAVRGKAGPVEIVKGLLFSPSFWLGLVAAGALLLLFLLALRETPVSLAYPVVTSLAIAGLLVLDYFVLGQAIGGVRLVGVFLIAAGVAAIFLGAPES